MTAIKAPAATEELLANRPTRRTHALLSGAGLSLDLRRWAIINVAPRRDNDVDNLLSRAMIEHWLPLKKADANADGRRRGAAGQPVWVLAWPGYIFVKIETTNESWHTIRSIKHVRRIFGDGERAIYLDDTNLLKLKAELATLKTVAGAETIFVDGETVRVVEGVFNGHDATVGWVAQDGPHAGRAMVEVMLFGRTVPVLMDIAQLAKG